jgi:hydroxyethylthiazole kinase-like uncharacterized protein yjeF
MDRYAIARLGIPGIELMRRAGKAAFSALRARWPGVRTVSVLCGSGNNGGDGYVVARLALEAGLDVRVYPSSPASGLQGDARAAFQDYQSAGGPILDFVPAEFEGAEVLVDALLGTGLDREVTGLYRDIISGINRFPGGVLALDIPSGLHADTGHPLGIAVKADLTVTFIGLKQGLFTGEGSEHCGEVVFDDLDTPLEVRQCVSPAATLLPPWERGLPPRPRAAHKGHFGHVLVIGGESGFSGAARLAGEAAGRVGAGLVSIATRAAHAGMMNLARPELMCHGVETPAELQSLLQRANVVAIGPGLGQSPWASMLMGQALASGLPLVVDADGLNLLARSPLCRHNWILTPHPGEAARMLQSTSSAVQRDRFAAVAALRERFGGTVVLKGSGTLVLGETGVPGVCTLGNPGMASGGVGDVLTGVIAGLVAQGMEPGEAAATGVRLHGAAGDVAARDGERGLLAADLMTPLRQLVNR